MIDTKQLDAEWTAALADAGIDREQTRLYVFDEAQGTDTSGAVWFRPGNELVVDHHFPNKDYLADANKDEHRRLHRIAVWRGVDLPVLGGRMRHELHHALQWDRHGYPVYALYDLVLELLSHKAAGLEGCGGMYVNAIPAEQDANAAAAMFVRNHHLEALEAMRQDADNRMLACSLVGPEPLDTLPPRMIEFMAVFPDRCEDVAKARGVPFQQVLDACYQDAGQFWVRLRDAETALDAAQSPAK